MKIMPIIKIPHSHSKYCFCEWLDGAKGMCRLFDTELKDENDNILRTRKCLNAEKRYRERGRR